MEDLKEEEKRLKNDLKNARYEEWFSRKDEKEHAEAKEKLNKARKELAKLKIRMYEEGKGIKR